jgi:transcriptional regulator with XRE-family HTH domain
MELFKSKKIVDSENVFDDLLSRITPEIQQKIDLKMDLAVKIFNGMKAKDWNKCEFARQMGKSNSIITRWLSGTHNFESDTLIEIQNKLGIRLLDCSDQNDNRIFTFPTNQTYNVFLNKDAAHLLEDFESVEINEFGLQITTTVNEKCN